MQYTRMTPNATWMLVQRCREDMDPYEVHSIPGGRDKADITDGVEGTKFVKCQAFVHEVDRHKLHRPKAAIDASNQFVDGRTQVLIFLDVLTGRNGELDQHHLPETLVSSRSGYKNAHLSDPFWVLCEEKLERVQLLGDTLDVVEAVDADDKLHTRKSLLQLSNTRLDRVFLQVLFSPRSVGNQTERMCKRAPQ